MKLFWEVCEFARGCALEGVKLSKEGSWLAYPYAVFGAILLVPLWAVLLTTLLLYLAPLGLSLLLRRRREAAKDDRYQNQPWEVQAYRWLKYKPYAAFRGACAALHWLAFDRTIPEFPLVDPDPGQEGLFRKFYGDKKSAPLFQSKWQMFKHVYCLNRSCWQYGLKHYYSMDEVRNRGN